MLSYRRRTQAHVLSSFFALLCTGTATPATYSDPCQCTVAPYISTRSQTVAGDRTYTGQANHTHLAEVDQTYGTVCLGAAYTRSYDPNTIAHHLFGCDVDSCSALHIHGSAASPNGTTDWLADWLYLGQEYTGSICFEPVVHNALLDINFYCSFDDVAPGLFFKLHAPIVWTKWDLNIHPGNQTGTDTLNFFTQADGLDSFFDYACHHKVTYTTTTNDLPLHYSRICPCHDTHTYLSDVHADLGWNMILFDRFHLGFFMRGSIPAGNTPEGNTLFEPVVGNGHHWELGGGVTSHVLFWHNQEQEDHHCGLYIDGTITHLFAAQQCRFFDLKNKPFSRYILAFKGEGDDRIASPVANLTAHEIRVHADLQTELTARFNYTHKELTWDVGYTFWDRTCDIFDTDCNATCCTAYDCHCSNPARYSRYCELDGATWYLLDENDTIHTHATTDQTRKYLSVDDIAYNDARTYGRTHTAFAHIAYSWYDDLYTWTPYIGLGSSITFGPHVKTCDRLYTPDSSTTTCSSCCTNTALSQWSIWFNGGIAF